MQKIDERKQKRTHKRRLKRRNKRAIVSWEKIAIAERPKRATAQESAATREKMKYGKEYRIATINIRGAKRQGAREEVEEWMKQHGIDIANVQETRIGINARDARNEYTCFSLEKINIREDT